MKEDLRAFDVSSYLESDEAIAEYLSAVLADGDSEEIIRAIGHIAKAKGMSQIAEKTGLGRESLYKTFTQGSKPRFETIAKVVHSFGFHFQVVR